MIETNINIGEEPLSYLPKGSYFQTKIDEWKSSCFYMSQFGRWLQKDVIDNPLDAIVWQTIHPVSMLIFTNIIGNNKIFDLKKKTKKQWLCRWWIIYHCWIETNQNNIKEQHNYFSHSFREMMLIETYPCINLSELFSRISVNQFLFGSSSH